MNHSHHSGRSMCSAPLFAAAILALLIGACSPAEKEKAKDDTVEKNIAMYTTTWDRVINKGELDLLDSAFSPGIVLHTKPNEIRGIDSAKAFYAAYLTGFSNREFVVKETFGQGEKLVKHWIFKGKHTGDFFGIPATGKDVAVEGTTIARISGGKIMEEQDFMDNLDFMQQLGIIPRQ